MAAKNKFLNAMKMPSIDDMFSSEADRQRESGDLVTEVPLSELHPFVGHPFEVRDDEDMQKLVDSIRENGVLTNLTVRRRAEGGYEIISGHRRFHAAQRAGLDSVKVQVRDIDDDQAIISMVDSNIQREHISPMEMAATTELFDRIANRNLTVRRITITVNRVVKDQGILQVDLFTDTSKLEREKSLQATMLGIKKKFGKNAVLKGSNYLEGATMRERNGQIGGHKAK